VTPKELQQGDEVMVKPIGAGVPRRAVVLDLFEKAARVRYDGDHGVALVSRRKISLVGARRIVGVRVVSQPGMGDPTESTKVAEHTLPPIKVVSWRELTPQRSPSFLAIVRATRCMCCGARPPSDPHHAGKRGVGQKCSDLLAVPLCRKCHAVVTDTNQLPGSSSIQASRSIIEARQVAQLESALARMPVELRLRVYVAGMATLDEAEMEASLQANPHSVRYMGAMPR